MANLNRAASDLFPDAETAKDRVQQVLARGFASDLAKGIHGLSYVDCDQIGRQILRESLLSF